MVIDDSCDMMLNVCKYQDMFKLCFVDVDCLMNELCIIFDCDEICIYW